MGDVGIIREQGEFMDVHPLTEEERRVLEEQQKNSDKNEESK